MRAYPDVGCSNCKTKGVKCTTEQILNPAKPNKGGKRIDEAKKLFGPDQAGSGDVSVRERYGEGLTISEAEAPQASHSTAGFAMTSQGVDLGTDNFDWTSLLNSNATMSMPTSNGTTQADVNLLAEFLLSNPNPQSEPPDPPWSTVPPLGHVPTSDLNIPTDNASPAANTTQPEEPDGFQIQVGDIHSIWRQRLSARDQEAAPYWDQLHARSRINVPEGTLTSSHSGPRFSSPFASTISEHLSSSNRSNMPELEFDAGMMSFVPRESSLAPQQAQPWHSSPALPSNQRPSPYSSGPPSASSSLSLFTSDGSNAIVTGRKRFRDDTPDVDDPWKIWTDPDQQQMIRWGRREAVQQQLADRALGRELSRHLVKVFFNFVHPSFPVSQVRRDGWGLTTGIEP